MNESDMCDLASKVMQEGFISNDKPQEFRNYSIQCIHVNKSYNGGVSRIVDSDHVYTNREIMVFKWDGAGPCKILCSLEPDVYKMFYDLRDINL